MSHCLAVCCDNLHGSSVHDADVTSRKQQRVEGRSPYSPISYTIRSVPVWPSTPCPLLRYGDHLRCLGRVCVPDRNRAFLSLAVLIIIVRRRKFKRKTEWGETVTRIMYVKENTDNNNNMHILTYMHISRALIHPFKC